MKVSALRESTAMASPAPREMEEELVSAGSEPGDTRVKPPVKPKPRALSSKPALPAKPSLLVPVGPRPPRGPLAELPSARKMNMLAGPQPYGGSKRPLPFAPRPAAEASAGGEATPETGKEEVVKEEVPPLTPPARCAPSGGVRKAPAPFRPNSERFAASTVEEILAKMDHPRKEVPTSPERLWGSRLTFNHDGSSRYGSRNYMVALGPQDEDGGTVSRGWPQEGPAKSPMEQSPPQSAPSEEHSRTPKERTSPADRAYNGDLAQLASMEPAAEVSKPWVPSSPVPASENGDSSSAGLPTEASGPPPGSPCLHSPEKNTSHHTQLPGTQSPSSSSPSPCLPATPASSAAAPPEEGACRPPSPGPPAAETPAPPDPGCPPLIPEVCLGDELLELKRTLPPGQEAVLGDLHPGVLAQRRFSEGVLRPPAPEPEKLGGSLAVLPQGQGSQSALDRPFGSGTESNWSLSQSFEWTFPPRPSGLGVWRLDSPPPSPITEATEAAEAAEAGDWAPSSREVGTSVQQGQSARPAQEGPGRPDSGVQADDLGLSSRQNGGGESQPPSPAAAPELLPMAGSPPGSTLLQAEERYEEGQPLARQESLLPLATGEAALPILEPVLGQQQPAPSDQPCVLFADTPNPGQALPAEEEAVTLTQAETTQPRTEAQEPPRVSPEPAGPESSSRWLDDLLASPPPSAGSARRAAGAELTDAQTPSACSEGLLGWAQKDLQSEFGIAADPRPGSFSPVVSTQHFQPSWSQDTSQDYGLGGTSPRGEPGIGERDWSPKCGQGAGEGSSREWASRQGTGQEEREVGGPDGSGASGPGGLAALDRVIGKPPQQGLEADLPAWEFRKRDSQGTYSSRDAELQDQEFGKRDSLGTNGSRDVGLRNWEFGQRDSLGAYGSRDPATQSQESGERQTLGRYSSQDAEEQDREFGKRESSLGSYGGGQGQGQGAEQLDQDFGKSAWMRDYSGGGSPLVHSPQDRGYDSRALSAGFSPEDAQQQDEEFEKKTPSVGGGLGEVGRDGSLPDERESGGLFSPSAPHTQGGVLGQSGQSSWQGQGASQEVGGLQGRPLAGCPSPGTADQGDRELGLRGWASDFSLGVVPQPDTAFGPGRRDWSGNFCMEAAERSHQFGIIGNDRGSGAGLSPPAQRGSGHFVSPEKTPAGPLDWTDQLGLRNLEVSSCVGSRGASEAREDALDQRGWSDKLCSRDVGLTSCLETGRSEEPTRGLVVGEKDWTSDVGVKSRELAGVGEVGGHGQTRESGVGQTDWSGVEAGESFQSRERGVGQADWTPDLGLRNMAAGCSSRELGVGQVDWGNNLGLRNLEVACDLEPEGSREPRGCGVGQVDWTQDLESQDTVLARTLHEAREHGVGEVSQRPDLGLRSDMASPGLEAGDPLEARELGVGEMSGPETQGDDEDSSPSLETCPADPGMETGGAPSFGASPGGCLARSPPSGSHVLLEEMLASSSSKAAARRESAASSLRGLLEEEGATAGADRGELLESGRDPLPSWRPQPDGEASRTEEVDGSCGPAEGGRGEQAPARPPRRAPQGPLPSAPSHDFSFIEDTEILDSAMYRSRASLGRKRGHRAPAIRPGGTLGLSQAADSDARLFQDCTEPRASRVPSSDEEVVEEPQNRRTRMSLGTKGLKVNLFPGLSPSALKAKLRPRNRSAEEGEQVETKSSQKETAVQRSKSCKVPGLGKPLALPPKPDKSSGSEGSSPNWLQALKLKKKKV